MFSEASLRNVGGSILVLFLCTTKLLVEVLALLDEMSLAALAPDVVSFNAAISGCEKGCTSLARPGFAVTVRYSDHTPGQKWFFRPLPAPK